MIAQMICARFSGNPEATSAVVAVRPPDTVARLLNLGLYGLIVANIDCDAFGHTLQLRAKALTGLVGGALQLERINLELNSAYTAGTARAPYLFYGRADHLLLRAREQVIVGNMHFMALDDAEPIVAYARRQPRGIYSKLAIVQRAKLLCLETGQTLERKICLGQSAVRDWSDWLTEQENGAFYTARAEKRKADQLPHNMRQLAQVIEYCTTNAAVRVERQKG